MAWPYYATAASEGDAVSQFQAGLGSSGVAIPALSPIGQLFFAVANLLQNSPSQVDVPAGDIVGGQFGSNVSSAEQYGIGTAALSTTMLTVAAQSGTASGAAIRVTVPGDEGVRVAGTSVGTGTTKYNFHSVGTFDSTTTANGYSFASGATTAAASFVMTARAGFYHANVAKGAASTITNDYAFYAEAPTQGSTLNLILGTNVAGLSLAATGAFATPSSVLSSGAAGGLGYATGAGTAQTQLTSKSTTVAANAMCGTITMHNATLNAATAVTFTFTNTSIAAGDMLLVQHDSVGTLGAYVCQAAPGAGTSTITVTNRSAGNLSEAIVLRFTVIKGVVA